MTKCLSSRLTKSLSLSLSLYHPQCRTLDPGEEWGERRRGMVTGNVARRKQRDKHVTKRAVNNADGQCCELRWYRTHKRHGFMLAATRRSQPRSAIVRASSTTIRGTNRVVTPDAFLFRNWCFLLRRLLRPRGRPFCRNKVTLLPVTLRSGTLMRGLSSFLFFFFTVPSPWPLFYCRRNLGILWRYYADSCAQQARP